MSGLPINPKVVGFFTGVWGKVTNAVNTLQSATAESAKWSWWDVAWTVALAMAFFITYITLSRNFETPNNVRVRVQNAVAACNATAPKAQRKSLKEYKTWLADPTNKEAPSAQQWILANFHVSTVNTAGLFYPAADGVFSPDAVRIAAERGARGFVFDIWGDSAGQPVLQTVEPGSAWRRISMNTLSFRSAFTTMIETVFGNVGGIRNKTLDTSEDFVIVYLRFRQPAPPTSVLDGVAATLRHAMEQYRMDASFNACAGQGRLAGTNIRQLAKKVIVVSNLRAVGTQLEDYINMAPQDTYVIEETPNNLAGLTPTALTSQKAKITRSIAFIAPLAEKDDPSYDWSVFGIPQGITCMAVNLLDSSDPVLQKYLKPEAFGTYSYLLKTTRAPATFTAPPDRSPDHGYGDGKLVTPSI